MAFLFAFAFKGIRRCVKSPNSLLFGYRQIAINGKYLWALPTPTTFEKVDQTFIFGTESLSFSLLCCPTDNFLKPNPTNFDK